MCCFSGEITEVCKTKIFARVNSAGVQFLAYGMDLDTPDDVAMILPIPIKAGEKVDFINLEEAPDLFEKIEALFPKDATKGMRSMMLGSDSFGMDTIEVEKVGAFEASFVPTIADFDRLDKRFTISKEIWNKIPEYKDFGFVVFKLGAGNEERHPMAFSFKSKDPKKLFFPTVHVHHGELPTHEEFDHVLYSQGIDGGDWNRESGLPGADLREKSKGLLAGMRLRKKTVIGRYPNKDIYADVE